MIWFLGAAAGAQISARAFPHYYATVIVPAAIIFALPLAPRRLLSRRAVAGIAVAAATVLAALVTLPFVRALRDDLRATPSAIALRMYGPESEVWNRAFAVGDLLRRQAGPGARLFVAGAEPEFYWTSGLPAASRYLYDYPAIFTPDRFLPEVTEDLCSRPPELLVLPSGAWPPYAQACINASRYREVAGNGAVKIYALRS